MSETNKRTAGEIVQSVSRRLKSAGFANPTLDARLLIASVLETDPTRLFSHPEMAVSEEHLAGIELHVERRLDHEPVSRILGVREFWSLAFEIDEHTLDPRPDSETLVESVLARVVDKTQSLSVLDMGTGSGCLILALLTELPLATGIGIDVNPGAVQAARRNAKNLGLENRVRFECSNWFSETTMDPQKKFDVLISNPPYISDQEIAELDREVVAYDPMVALAGGADGLDAYRALLPEFERRVSENGFIGLEIGWQQARSVEKLGQACGLELESVVKDLAERDRVLIFRKRR